MIKLEQLLVCVIIALFLGPHAAGAIGEAGSPERNYQVIIDRNPFGLKPTPPPPTNTPVVNQPKDEILLTGITSIGAARAYFMSKAPQGKTPEYYSLGLDESRNGLEILEINPLAKSVRVRNAGIEAVMTFASNGVKPPATAAGPAPGLPGAPPPPGAAPLPGAGVVPGVNVTPPAMVSGPSGIPSVAPTGRGRTIPSRIPSRNVRTMPADMGVNINPPGENQPVAAPDPNAPVHDALMMELQRRAQPNVTFPPTPMPQ